MVRRLFAAALLAAFAGSASPVTQAVAAPSVEVGPALSYRVVSEPHDGHHIVLHRDQAVAIRLTVCGTCGYSLRLTRAADARVARFDGRSSLGSTCGAGGAGAPVCVGGSERVDYDFVATGLGQTQVTFTFTGPGRHPAVTHRTIYLVVVRRERARANASLHLVRAGDTLYRIARAELGSDVTAARLRSLAARIYADNHQTIGGNPGFLLPGEMLFVDPTGIAPCATTSGRLPCDG